MPRFDKLEFNPQRESTPEAAPPDSAGRDAAHWLKQADQERRTGQYENALKFYSRALEMDKSLVGGWVGQVQMLVLLDEHPEADLWGRKAMELFPGNGELMAGRAQACCRLGDKKQAHALCDGAMQQAGQSAYRWLVRGELMVAGRQSMDGHCFEKAQQLDPDWLVPLEIALVYRYYRSPSKVSSYARRAVELAPDAYYAWYIQGLCQFDLGLKVQAQQSLHHCLELCPRHVEAARCLVQMQQLGWSFGGLLHRLFRRS